MRFKRLDRVKVAAYGLVICLMPGCGKAARTGLENQLAGHNDTAGASGSHADYSAFLPDSSRTPGDTLPVTADDVCVSGYSGKVRNVPTEEKTQVYQEYGIMHHEPHEYEIDHLISLELGGSNRKENLWPQSYLTQPWNAHVKDRLEDKLHEMVCTGQTTLKTAQDDIRTDWIAAYKRVFHTDQPTSGSPDGTHHTQSREIDGAGPNSRSDSGSAADHGSADKVWVNLRSGKYFLSGSRYYGNTKEGQYMTEAEAQKAGYVAASGR